MSKKFNPTMLKSLRYLYGWTYEDLSKKTGISTIKLSNFEFGRDKPTLENIAKLAWNTDVTTEFFYQKDLPQPFDESAMIFCKIH